MVQFNTPEQEEDVWGMIEGRSIPSLSFSVEAVPGSKEYISRPVGTEYTITTTEPLQKRQATDFTTGELKFYDAPANKQPIWDLIATGQTDQQNDEDDDGIRRLFFTGQMRKALQDEVRNKKIGRFGIGTQITVKLTGFKPSTKPNGKPTKLFDVTVNPTPWVSPAELQTESVLAAAGYTEVAAAPAAVAPVAVPPAAPQAVAAPPAAPAAPDADTAAMAALLAMTAAPAAIVVDPVDIGRVDSLIKANIDRAAAIAAAAKMSHPGDEAYRAALDNEIPI